MKRWFLGVAFAVLITLGFGGTAFATITTDLELISGGEAIYINIASPSPTCGPAPCPAGTTGGAVAGGLYLSTVGFNGWTVSISTVTSNSPNCFPGLGGTGCLNSFNITADATGASTLGVFDFSSGFSTPYGFIVTNTTTLQSGMTESQQAYATTSGADPLGVATTTFANAVLGQVPCGAPLTVTLPGIAALPTSCASPGNPVSLELATIFTTNSSGGGFTVGGNISSVPEPVSVVLFGTVLALCASGLRRRRKLS